MAPFKVLLNGGEQVTYARSDGSFVFRDVAPGRYVVDIPSEQYLFSQYKLDIAEDGVIRALEYKYPGAAKLRADYPLAVEAVTELDYFEEREKFNLLGLIMSPSFLTVIVPIGLLYILPKLSESMMGTLCMETCDSVRPATLTKTLNLSCHCCLADPEEFKKAQEEIGTQDPAALISGMFGGGAPRGNDDSDDD